MKTPQETDPTKDYSIPIVGVFPGMDPTILNTFVQKDTKAIVVESNARAALAEDTYDTVRSIVDRGIPVIVLADEYGERHGITHIADEPQRKTLEAGAIYLETLGVGAPNADDNNQGHIQQVVATIEDGIKQGLNGVELSDFVRTTFSYPEGKKPQRPDPVGSLRDQHDLLATEGLGVFTINQTLTQDDQNSENTVNL